MQDGDDEDQLRHGVVGVGVIFERHSPAVFRLAFAFLRDAEDASEVVQETFFLLWKKRSKVTLVNSSALPWLLATARLTALATRRARALRQTRMVELDAARGVALPPLDDHSAVMEAFSQLPPADQQILRLVLIDDKNYADTASQLNISVSATGKRLQRARARFRTLYHRA